MEDKKIFTRDKNLENDSAEELNKIIRVVPSLYYLVLVGCLLIAFSIVIWGFAGWVTITSSTTGIYHPGAVREGEILCFMPISSGKTIDEGMDATVYLSSYDQQEYGHMKGVVSYIDPYTTSVDEMKALLGDDLLVNMFVQSGPVVMVVVKLTEDDSFANGYYWSNERGGNIKVNDGMWASVSVVTSKIRPITVVYPNYGE